MVCSEIHNDGGGCDQAVPEKSAWKFCPHCGRLLGHAVADESPFTPLPGVAQHVSLRVRCTGIAAVSALFTLEAEVAGAQLAGNATRTLRPRQAETLELDLPPLTAETSSLGRLILQAEDGAADDSDDPWQSRPWNRTKAIPLLVRVARPACLRAAQDVALFSEQTARRTIDLINEGDQPLAITEIRMPRGYVLEGPQPSRLAPHGIAHLVLRRDWAMEAPPDSLLQVLAGSSLSTSVRLRSSPRHGVQELPAAIVGIDFGTAYTSVAFRKCLYNPDLADKVEFLRPPGQETERFPTRLWLGKDNSARYGLQAKTEFLKDESAGYLFREIKTMLRQVDNNLIHPRRFQGAAFDHMSKTYGARWPEVLVTRYLTWLREKLIFPELQRRFGSTDVNVQYIFSLPVLDFATDSTIYSTQLESTRRCAAAAGFPVTEGRVAFQFEPVCAALGLLYSTDEDFPRLGSRAYPIQGGDHIAVFDSGGGTTDIVLARVEATGDQGEIALHVEHCLGVGSQVETFGGEWVTDALHTVFSAPKDVPGDRTWYSGPISLTGALEAPDDELARDEIEIIKRELADNDFWEYTDQHTNDDVKITSAVLGRLINPHLKSLSSEMRQRVFTQVSREATRYYLCVGGNTALKDVEAWVQAFMQDEDPEQSGRQLRVPEHSRQMAVAYGAAWVPDARIRNAVPYDLALLVGDRTLLTIARNTSQEVYGLSSLFQLGPHQTLDFQLQTTVDGSPCRVASAALTNHEDDTVLLTTFLDVQNGTLMLNYSMRSLRDTADTHDQMELLTYNF